jgi:hypothetical protein
VDGVNLTAGEVTVEVGRWDYATKLFTPGNNASANGVRVSTRRNNVQMMLAKILGQSSKNMGASAIAVMDFATAVGKGTLPIAVNQTYAEVPGTPVYIGFNPDPVDNGGWFALAPDSASASTFIDYINEAACSPLNVGDPIELQNGCDTAVLQHLKDALAARGGDWVVLLPVVNTPKFDHADQIDAFAPVKITEVKSTGSPKYVKGTVLTMAQAAAALPGGGKFGALAPPKLVQ